MLGVGGRGELDETGVCVRGLVFIVIHVFAYHWYVLAYLLLLDRSHVRSFPTFVRCLLLLSHPPRSSPPSFLAALVQSIAGLRSIHCNPAGLESTSLVLAVGLDLFASQVAPSKPFDVLKADFNYTLLIVIIGAVAVATVVLSQLVKIKELGAAWN